MTNISCTNFRGGILGHASGEEGRTRISNMQPPKISQFHMGKKMFVSSKLQGKMSNTYFQVNINGSI